MIVKQLLNQLIQTYEEVRGSFLIILRKFS